MRCIYLSFLCLFFAPHAEPQESLVNGEKNSAVPILEFSDLECPFSAKAAPIVNELIRANSGKVRLVFRHSPLPFHQHSVLAREAALASAAQGKFWEMHDLLFANQTKLTLDDLVRFATQLKLDLPSFPHAVESGRYLPLIQSDEEEAKGLGVAGTPTFFINIKKIVGAQALETFESVLDEALGETTQKIPFPKFSAAPVWGWSLAAVWPEPNPFRWLSVCPRHTPPPMTSHYIDVIQVNPPLSKGLFMRVAFFVE